MSEITCPYCDHEWYEEPPYDDYYNETQCDKCEKIFYYEPEYTVQLYSHKADCLNGGEHDWKPHRGAPKEYFEGKFYCSICSKTKQQKATE